MAWNELITRRTRTAKQYRDDTTGQVRYEQRIGTVLHYPTAGADSATLDGTIDMSPVRVNNAVFDGWRITANDWHYAIGKDITGHGQEDGWVGFGGRQGQNWFKFRLERGGYLKWSTREWGDLGTVDYNRARLTRTTNSITVGPAGATTAINTICQARWNDMYPALPSGQVDILWRVEGRELKEEIIINQAAREWIAANRAPSFFFPGTPASDVYFGFVFKLDWSDVPHIYRGEAEKQVSDDYDDGEAVTLQDDSLNHLLDFMPLDRLYVPGTDGRLTLRKRFYSEGGNHYLLVGARCDQLAALPAGDLVFDPTLTTQPDATAGIDVRLRADDPDFAYNDEKLSTKDFGAGSANSSLVKFDLSSIPGTATIDSATLSLWVVTQIGLGFSNTVARILAANSAWTEGATWNYAVPSTVRWAGDTGANGGTDAGCSVSATDFSSTALGTFTTVTSAAVGTQYDTTLNTTEVATLRTTNNGIVIYKTSGLDGNPNEFRSSDNATAAERPKLVVNYTEATTNVSTSETVTLAEVLTKNLVALVKPADTITLTETVSRILVARVSASETVTLSEATIQKLVSLISASETVTLSETVTVALAVLQVSASETVALSELTTVTTSAPQVSVSETIELTESANATIASAGEFDVDASETITIQETATVTTSDPQVSTDETITLSEAASALLVGNVSASEVITLTDNAALAMADLQLSAAETVTLVEATAERLVSLVSVSETVTLSETVTITTSDPQINIDQTVELTESLNVNIVVPGLPMVQANDSVNLAEIVTVAVSNPQIVAAETVTLVETVTANLAISIDTSETVTLSETVSQVLLITAVASESITLVESLTVSPLLLAGVSVDETITLTESLSMVGIAIVAVVGSVMGVRGTGAVMGVRASGTIREGR